jgi:hypothetical protein
MWDLQLSGDTALLVGIVLLPGAIAVFVRNYLGKAKELGAWLFMIHAAVFDIPIFIALLAMRPWGLTPIPTGGDFNWMTLVAAGMLAVFLGAVTGRWAAQGTWQEVLFKLGWTKKGKLNAWVDGFQCAEKEGAWAYVHLRDGRRLLGAPKYFSSDSESTTVFLVRGPTNGEPVQIFDKDGQNPIPQTGPGVLITPAAKITLVSFLDPPEKASER